MRTTARGETGTAWVILAVNNSIGGVCHFVPDAHGVARIAVARVLVALGVLLRNGEAAGDPFDDVKVDTPAVAL